MQSKNTIFSYLSNCSFCFLDIFMIICKLYIMDADLKQLFVVLCDHLTFENMASSPSTNKLFSAGNVCYWWNSIPWVPHSSIWSNDNWNPCIRWYLHVRFLPGVSGNRYKSIGWVDAFAPTISRLYVKMNSTHFVAPILILTRRVIFLKSTDNKF